MHEYELGEATQTQRGFTLIKFRDNYDHDCIVQESSAIDGSHRGVNNPGSSYLWIGCSDSTRMHLSRLQVAQFVDELHTWLKTGRLRDPEE